MKTLQTFYKRGTEKLLISKMLWFRWQLPKSFGTNSPINFPARSHNRFDYCPTYRHTFSHNKLARSRRDWLHSHGVRTSSANELRANTIIIYKTARIIYYHSYVGRLVLELILNENDACYDSMQFYLYFALWNEGAYSWRGLGFKFWHLILITIRIDVGGFLWN